jgi:alpha-L-arabinofuranosidase
LRPTLPAASLFVQLIAFSLAGLSSAALAAETPELTIRADQPGPRISPMLYGLMTEEINHSYDGGLYAELIQNRIFRDTKIPSPPRRRAGDPPAPLATQPATVPSQPLHWSLVTAGGAEGSMTVDTDNPVNTVALTHSLRLDVRSASGAGARVGVANDGYWGIPVKPSTPYRASFYARTSPGFSAPINVSIESSDNNVAVASATVSNLSTDWKRYEVTLKTGADVATSSNNRFVLSTSAPGSIWFNLVSLFSPTFHDRPNGTRIDLMQLLAGMHPSFLRFPGGNYVEGDYFNERFNWKETIGPLEQRPGHNSPWRYRSSDGLGLLEFLEWCEDLKMEPVLAVFAGYTLRGQHIVGPELQPYIDEALEEIEYVTGGADTHWGRQRAKDGHPEPFKLTYVEIGNEDWFDARGPHGTYDGRFTQFYDAIKTKYPKLQLIATAKVSTRTPDVIDDHYYRPAAAMQRDVHHYDKTDRNGPKIFVGEWASRENPPDRTLTPTLHAALGDAAWMTGLERNSDVVVMSCYAPLLINLNRGAWQWEVDLIGYDAARSFGSPSYYIQAIFAQNRGDVVLPVNLTNATDVAPEPAPPASLPAPAPATGPLPAKTSGAVSGTGENALQRPTESLFATASRDDASGDVIVKFVNTRATPQDVHIVLKGISNVSSATGTTVTGNPADMNSLSDPMKIAPRPLEINPTTGDFTATFPAHSASVVRLKTR